MDIPTEWLSSQLVLGVVLIVLVAVGVVFYFRVGGREGQPAGEDGAVAHHGGHVDDGPVHDDAAGPTDPGTHGPITPVASTSVFETEPCWVSLMPGRGRPASDEVAAPSETAPPARA